MLQVLQTEVLQLALQFVESELVGEWGIEVTSFLAHLMLRHHLFCVTYLSHHVHTVGYHDEDHAHVLRERDEQVAKILALDDWVALV